MRLAARGARTTTTIHWMNGTPIPQWLKTITHQATASTQWQNVIPNSGNAQKARCAHQDRSGTPIPQWLKTITHRGTTSTQRQNVIPDSGNAQKARGAHQNRSGTTIPQWLKAITHRGTGTPCVAPVLDGERGVTQARVRGCPVSA
jgi:ribosomal protein L39E